METLITTQQKKTSVTKPALWTGRIISSICIAFLLFDAVGKIIREAHTISACMTLGIPENTITGIGITLFLCTILYLIPKTSVIGAISLTGYLGGAVAIMNRAGQPVYFALAFGVLIWLGLYLRNQAVRKLFALEQ
ncbi:DoxX family protein [Pedobacter rhodius]|uniref:DoxX family protein n=1 Tax=Pedobacter rhodius TaxID=3004098 RepID=A0ABT4L2J2_9SPHI|nr:DoxX family protein [Pedobacter sp. SJ11]MCZ4225410.1 DoxX family protein [Pedobacter sp. SJ11]